MTAMSNYIGIQTEWLTEWGLTPAEAVVYGYLYGWLVVRKDKTIPFRKTQEEMAKAVGMDERRFKRQMARLASYGCITTERTGTTTTYTLHARILNNEPVTKLSPSDKNVTECQNCHPVSDKNVTEPVTKLSPDTILNISLICESDNAHAHTRENQEKEKKNGDEKSTIENKYRDEALRLGEVHSIDELADELNKEFKQGSSVAEGFAYNYGLTIEQMEENLGYFVHNLRIVGVTLKTRSDFRRHFVSWLTNRLKKQQQEQKNGYKQQQGVTDDFIRRAAERVAQSGGLAF